nr:unnamed protein product [Digitaria exilis]
MGPMGRSLCHWHATSSSASAWRSSHWRTHSTLYLNNSLWINNPCSFAMVVEDSWYTFTTTDLYGNTSNKFPRGVPYVIVFAIRNAKCPVRGQQAPLDYACVRGNSTCADVTNGYVCKCLEHYEGNPYILNGCQGCFGEVYKGILDNNLVAVKRPISGGKPENNEQFVNEVVIQSQVIHKNIIRLIGCCLEVDIPMLVHEFLPREVHCALNSPFQHLSPGHYHLALLYTLRYHARLW